MIRWAPHAMARLAMLIMWRAGLRVSEAVALSPIDLHLNGDPPTLVVREAKGGRQRAVPIHP